MHIQKLEYIYNYLKIIGFNMREEKQNSFNLPVIYKMCFVLYNPKCSYKTQTYKFSQPKSYC